MDFVPLTPRVFSAFAGAGSLLLGDWLGWQHVGAFERDPYCRAVLAARYPNLGRGVDGLADRMDWPARAGDFPASPGEAQRAWEPTRSVTACYPGRKDRLRAIGNGWCIPAAVKAWGILNARIGTG